MYYLYKIIIGRHAASLNKTFTYYSNIEYEIGIRVIIPFNASKQEIGIIVEKDREIDSLEEFEKENFKLQPIISSLDEKSILSANLLKLLYEVSDYYKSDLISIVSSFLPSKLKVNKKNITSNNEKQIEFVFAYEHLKIDSLSTKAKELYLKILKNKEGIRKSLVSAKKTLNELINLKYLYIKKISVDSASLIEASKLVEFKLTTKQQEIFNQIYNGIDKTYLLEGVTGSGKTNIYIKLIQNNLAKGLGSILLVPEIALTDNLVNLLTSYFKEDIALIHSSISQTTKYKEFKKIINGEKRVVVGTRSAIFAPVKNLSLIIIDEEHSSSYKQNNDPFYDARQIAQFRSSIEGCKVVYGSATPTIVTKAKATKGLFKQLYLLERYNPTNNSIHIIDLNNSDNYDPNLSSFYSKPVIEAIKDRLNKKQQSMILINRRGYSPIYLCRKCHKVVKCPNCDLPLTYHKKDDSLRCHHCNYILNKHEYKCSCGSNEYTYLGFGTERAYEELKFLFPQAKIYRMDSDLSHTTIRHEVLTTFKEGEGDILVGTQIIAKGHDFPLVSCGVVVDLDNLLRIPSYLAGEETFDLISQFIGRSGRNNLSSDIYIQTYLPNNQIIEMASKQDYESFYKYELEERKKYLFPPYVYLSTIIFKGYDEKKVIDACLDIKNLLLSIVGNKQINIYGPQVPYISYMNNKHTRYLLLKYKSQKEMSIILDKVRSNKIKYKDVSILINVDLNGEII